MNKVLCALTVVAAVVLGLMMSPVSGEENTGPGGIADILKGERLFARETFGGNGRTCLTCHSRDTGTVSPEDARKRFKYNPHDPLFLHDGSDDGHGHGVSRMLNDATILVEIPLHPNVRLADDPYARTVTVRRSIPATLNTPALDPVLMWDGRQPDLVSQAEGAIQDHTQSPVIPDREDLQRIADFQLTNRFFSSIELRRFAHGGPDPKLPEGRTRSEKRGRRFFEDAPFAPPDKAGLCAVCHSGPMLNETNRFFPFPLPPGSRFQSVQVSEFNEAKNPVREFVFTNPDGTETRVQSPDPGRALITGIAASPLFDNLNAFKIPTLWGVRNTAPYFHDNSARTLEDLVTHYGKFFELISDPDGPAGPAGPVITLSEQDKEDIVAYMKLLK
jgi:cytochrome c peroxidase